MDSKVLFMPIWIKLIILIFALGGIALIVIYNLYIIGSFLFIFFIIIFYFTLVKYIFEDEKIIIKYPLFYTKEYQINNINGYTFIVSGADIELILFTENNKYFKIKIIGKNIKKYIELFLDKINPRIEENNINELNNNGIEYKFKKNKYILFTLDYIEIKQNGNIKKYSYKTDIENIILKNYNGMILIQIILNDKNKLYFNDYILKGKKGLYKYLTQIIDKKY